ncbi:Mce family protein [Gordonia araii NBRC 100433]|uniref:Mce family protein n=1 Tax=Gordonia araii NBRC 100433 TaxID=1073574 RepID=G7GXB0_9ACTN|nr:MlaD family protein [Gordonia araii]GAB08235.1 Mce family protein [Gordonia araii NBRC 100433]
MTSPLLQSPHRSPSVAAVRLRGLITLVVIVCGVVVLAAYARGEFSARWRITVDAATIGEGLVTGADVKLNGYAIGRVRAIDTVGYGRQRIALDLEPDQAAHLTNQVKARFTSSNMFGATGIELIPVPGGTPLRDGDLLVIGADSSQITVSGLFSRAGKVARELSSPEVLDLINLMVDNSRGLGRSMVAFLQIAAMLRDEQRGSLSKYLEVGAEMGSAVQRLTPLIVAGVVDLVEQTEYFGPKENRERTNRAIGGLNKRLLYPAGDLVAKHEKNFSTIITTALDLVIPISVAIGSLAPTYNGIPEIIANIRSAFPEVAGKPQLQLRIVATNFPQVVSALPQARRGGR